MVLKGGNYFSLIPVPEFIEVEVWLLLTCFRCLHNQLSSIHSIVTCKRRQMFKKGHSSNKQKMNSWSFQHVYCKIQVGFCHNTKKRFFLDCFILVLICDNHLKFWTFSILYLRNKFSQKRKPFSKNWRTVFYLKVRRLKTQFFPYKSALSEASVKAIRMGSIKWTYDKELGFGSNYFTLLKILFQFKSLL